MKNDRRIVERIRYHRERDHATYMVIHNVENFHADVNNANFKIINIILVITKGNTKLPSLCGSNTSDVR